MDHVPARALLELQREAERLKTFVDERGVILHAAC
jgi:hypothetical protein